MREQAIQTKIKKKLQSQGYVVVNLIKTSLNGIPDLMALKDGKVKFIEVKTKNGVLSAIQKVRIKQLKQKGFEVHVWVDFEIPFKWDEINGVDFI